MDLLIEIVSTKSLKNSLLILIDVRQLIWLNTSMFELDCILSICFELREMELIFLLTA